jgi:hypothetical protein
MKYLVILVALSACATVDSELQAHLEAEADFARHQYHTQQAHEKQYDPEYVDDCYYYEELVCEFE